MTDANSQGTPAATFDPLPVLASELGLPRGGIEAVLRLLAEDNTVPFIARYRKEATGGLDEVQIRTIGERQEYLRDLEDRRQKILASIADQGKLTAELRGRILGCSTKATLEDLYLPYKPKRRTRATIARERGLEPLAARIIGQGSGGDPFAEAAAFVDQAKGVDDIEAALAGARDIVAEQVTENANIRAAVRATSADQGVVVAAATAGATDKRTKFEQYYEFREGAKEIPSHRFLAIRRGEREKVLKVSIEVDVEAIVARIERAMKLDERSPFAAQLREAVADAYRRLLAPSVEKDIRAELKQRADGAAVDVFADNLKHLLLAPPLGAKPVIGVDPGLRTGCKCAAVDGTGKFLDNTTIYINRGEKGEAAARPRLTTFIEQHDPAAIAVGNGTGGRETEAFVRKLLASLERSAPFTVQVNESGASIYSASDVAREEFPELDLTVRGAISIARRLQDPLAELVKIEPKAIGVGQYQHDVHQPLLQQKLGEVIEDCVNHIGVEVNTASASLRSDVAGVRKSLAKKLVAHREQHGRFGARQQLLAVSGLGPRAFEQAAGFLRIRGADHPLDASAVHPERYALVERVAKDLGVTVATLVGDAALASKIDTARYVSDEVGEPTLRDIVEELRKPGRDPREEFEPPKFRDDVNTLNDLQQGMSLEGVVTNVTAFGAFVDVGVHQDGLVHISELADHFVKDPKDVVKVGDKIKVRVLGVDLDRKRISLSARSEPGPRRGERDGGERDGGGRDGRRNGGARGDRSRGDGPRADRGRGGGSGGGGRPPGDRFSHNPFARLGKLKK